jgi:hypothetical protein
MAEMHGTMGKPLEETADALRRVAAEQKWTFMHAESTAERLVFTRGFSLLSWGSRLEASLSASSPDETGVSLKTSETFALADWGRGKRDCVKLLEGAGASII